MEPRISARYPVTILFWSDRPIWFFDVARTQSAYRAHGLDMLLTDISARDGKIFGWHISLRRRIHFRTKLAEVLALVSKRIGCPSCKVSYR